MSYCNYIHTMKEPGISLHQNYHDQHYGFPIHDDNELFGRLLMEINQAGLSWEIILKKEKNIRQAYDNFNIEKVARYTDKDRERLLNDSGIIRNKLKVNAAIENAKTILAIQREYGTFEKWMEHQYPKSKEEWVQLFKKTFRFTGGEIVKEFLMSIGYLPGAHTETCPIYQEVLKAKPMCFRKLEHINIQDFINDWIVASNAFDTEKYLDFYLPDAVLDDPSVGRKFSGHKGVKEYFESYFIGYNTHTNQVNLVIADEENAHLEVEFTGDFPEGKIGGTFDFKIRIGKIAFVKADLIH
jgi:DNA-3-methyladenine glycosylase I